MKYVMGVLVQQTVIILLLFSIADVLPGTEGVSLNGVLIYKAPSPPSAI